MWDFRFVDKIRDRGWEGIFLCKHNRRFVCDQSMNFGLAELWMCNCPVGVRLITSLRKNSCENMKNPRIALIVASEDRIRKLFSRLLRKIKVSFMIESDQTTALLRLLEMHFRVLIVDMSSPQVNGRDFIYLVKKIRPRLPIIAVTESDKPSVYESLLDAGAMYCIVKDRVEKDMSRLIKNFIASDSGESTA
jgi:CheY-like chemotaxis protein